MCQLDQVSLACPNCPTAQAVRASVMEQAFWTHLSLVGLPVLVMAGIALLFYRSDERNEPRDQA